MKNILVTGGAGFIGSNFIKLMLKWHPDYKLINVDALTYAGNLENLKDIEDNINYTFIRADIRDRIAIDEIFASHCIDIVVNFAAESHVDRSIIDPEVFLTTNALGTQVLLDTAKNYWKINPNDKYCKKYQQGVKFLQVSTDEVYGTLGQSGMFLETMPLLPNSPYSASKASADMIVRAYHETFGMPVNITRCSNNYGSYQFPEKLIPLIIINCLEGKDLPVYGDGMQVRDWLHVSDHCAAIDTVLHKGAVGEVYNIGCNNEKANIEIVKLIISTLGISEDLIKYVKDRPGHDKRYAIDSTKIKTQLGWVPNYTFEQGMKETIEWYLNNTNWIENIISGDYVKYYEKMYCYNERKVNMDLYEKILNKKEKMSIVGLGYVGLPIAVSFSRKVNIIGFDINEAKIDLYKKGIDSTKEVGDEALVNCNVDFTSDEIKLREAKFHIIAVPTPVNADHTPDLRPIESASRVLGRNLTKDSIVVYESTVYPGVTEDICVPILEKESGLKYGVDFKVGYSPERINPGDKVHRLETIVKIVSGMDKETLETVAKVYELVVDAGVHRAESIKVAEAAKVIENSQRDINIAFMNELSIIFNRMGIDTKAVLEAAGSKWNFLKFSPGLVGGHCIGVDPYYLTYKAEEIGYHSQIILSGRKINDGMGKYVAENTVKKMIKANKQINGSKVAIFGITFKEDCPDVRNTKVIDIIKELEEYGSYVKIVDPVANKDDLWHEYRITPCDTEEINDTDAVIFAVPHEEFKVIKLEDIKKMFRSIGNIYSNVMDEVAVISESCLGSIQNNCVLIDVKGMFNRKEAEDMGFLYWRL